MGGASLDFPESVVSFFKGEIGQPVNGFPEALKKVVLKDIESIDVRPGELLAPIDFDLLRKELEEKQNKQVTEQDIISYALYPKVYEQYITTNEKFANVSLLDTPTFFYGMRKNEKVEIAIDEGKTLIVNLISVGHVHEDGYRWVYFDFNGMSRKVYVKDTNVEPSLATIPKADPKNRSHIGAQMPGTVGVVKVKEGDVVTKGQSLLITEAMKMETTIQAPFSGTIDKVYVNTGDSIQTTDLLVEISEA